MTVINLLIYSSFSELRYANIAGEQTNTNDANAEQRESAPAPRVATGYLKYPVALPPPPYVPQYKKTKKVHGNGLQLLIEAVKFVESVEETTVGASQEKDNNLHNLQLLAEEAVKRISHDEPRIHS